MKRIKEALEHELGVCRRTYGNQATNRRLFVFDALEFGNAAVAGSPIRGLNESPSGALIRYLVLACDIVMDEDTLGPEALVVLIRNIGAVLSVTHAELDHDTAQIRCLRITAFDPISTDVRAL